jgi:hypothetical protein
MRVNVNRCPSGQLQSQNRGEIPRDGCLVGEIHRAVTRGIEDLYSQSFGGGFQRQSQSRTAQLSVTVLYALV